MSKQTKAKIAEVFQDAIVKRRKGGTRKIADIPHSETCQHPEHNPPSMLLMSPGVYEHECPACGKTQTFMVTGHQL